MKFGPPCIITQPRNANLIEGGMPPHARGTFHMLAELYTCSRNTASRHMLAEHTNSPNFARKNAYETVYGG